jgi:hypothetical protein
MSKLQINLYQQNLIEVFGKVRTHFPNYDYDFKKHVVLLKDEQHDEVGFIRLPLHIVLQADLTIETDAARVLYLAIESGNAAICIMEGKVNVYHTTFSAYMSRKKQGFSQIKYLNKKGKSRAGSRMRLSGTTTFFENINEVLTELLEEFELDRIGLSCTTTLIPYLFQSKVPCPFDKKSPLLYKIPLHLPQSNFTNLDAAIKKLRAPVLFFEEQYESQMSLLVNNSLL